MSNAISPSPSAQSSEKHVCAMLAATLVLATVMFCGLNAAHAADRAETTGTQCAEERPTALMITWKTRYGKWSGAGPTQALWTAYDTEEEAMNLLYNEDKDAPVYLGSYGRLKIYTMNRPLEKWEYDVRRHRDVRNSGVRLPN